MHPLMGNKITNSNVTFRSQVQNQRDIVVSQMTLGHGTADLGNGSPLAKRRPINSRLKNGYGQLIEEGWTHPKFSYVSVASRIIGRVLCTISVSWNVMLKKIKNCIRLNKKSGKVSP